MFFDRRCEGLGQVMLMLQSMLADRFKLKVRRETRSVPAYALVVTETGPKFLHTTFPLDDTGALGKESPERAPCRQKACSYDYTSLGQIAYWLSLFPEINRPVVDQTGIKGNYYIQLQWDGNDKAEENEASPQVSSGPSIFTAVQEQLGLKLEATQATEEVLVIDHIDRPSEN